MTIAAAAASLGTAAGLSAGAAGAMGTMASGALGAAGTAGIGRLIGGSGGGGGQQGGVGNSMMQGLQDYVKNIDMSQPEAATPDIQPNFARNPIPAPNGQGNQSPTQQFSPMPGANYSPVAQSPSQGFGQAAKFGQDHNGQILGIQDFIQSLTRG
jgi:hypothetical protein